jgi:hypothetical protein
MKRYLGPEFPSLLWMCIASLIVFLCLTVADAGELKPEYKYYQFNEHVMIVQTDMACPIKPHVNEYPQAVVAFRLDGSRLVGCYKIVKNEMVIQWQDLNGYVGDISRFPTRNFSPEFPEGFKPPATL